MYEKLKVIEYDISSANASVMFQEDLISKEKYDKLMNMPKKKRNITVGMMIRDGEVEHNQLMNMYKKYTDRFIKENEMEGNVYETVKDAVWVFNKMAHKTEFGEYVKFTKDRIATSILELRNIKFYYNSTSGKLFNRGLGDIDHDIFIFMNKIKKFMMLKESEMYKELYKRIHEFHLKYINKELDIKYRYDVRKRNKNINKDRDPLEDGNYKLIKYMINYLL